MPPEGFSYSEQQVAALEATMSAERLSGYLQRAGGDKLTAIKLYERNKARSESLFGVIQALEVALRNKLHGALAEAFSEEWYWHRDLPLLAHPLPEMLEDAIVSLESRKELLPPVASIMHLRRGVVAQL